MKIRDIQQVIIAMLLMLFALPAVAHPVAVSGSGLVNGLIHPLAGMDHVLAMIAVGLWAARRGAQVEWKIPIMFSIMLLAGAVLAISSLQLPWLETLIASSMLVLGLLISLQPKVRTSMAILLIGGFAVYHGYAHGIVSTVMMSSEYLVGLWVSTALLQLVGVAMALLIARMNMKLLRWSGVPLIAVGALLLTGI